MWELTPYALQMSRSLIISPAFHARVNFIIPDTCMHSEVCTRVCVCVCTGSCTYTNTCTFLQTAAAEEPLHQRQLSLISLYLRHLFLAYSVPPLSLHTRRPLPLLFPTALSHLYLPAREILRQREVVSLSCDFWFYIHLPFLESSLS